MIFKRRQYCYNSETLKFEEVRSSLGKRFLRFLANFVYLNILALFVLFLILSFVDSPEATIQKARISKHTEKYQKLALKVDSLSEILQDQFFTADQNYRYILELDSLPTNIRYAGTGGTDPYASSPRSYYNKNYAELNHKITNLKDKIVIQDESYEEIMKAALDKKKQLAHFPGITPVKSDTYVWISSFFGTRNDPFTFQHRTHLGLDFVAPFNTKVYATANGTVTLVKHSRRGYGNEIVIDHGFGYKTRYAHLNKTLIQEGQEVERGELIGLMGNTGRSTGTHLHYEVHLYNNPVNPLYFFADDLGPEEFEQLTVKQNN